MTFYSAWIAAPLMLLLTVLGLRISGLRVSGAARAAPEPFTRWQRAHGNAVEHVPFVMLLLFMLELARGGKAMILAIGVPFVLARLGHAYGTTAPRKWPKFIGAAVTYAVELAVGVLLLVKLAQGL